mmetsp:Transcript_21615/g.45472  ORF Transcript_21615/g.45472 Transcript_21615/m.45472 type:complete len:739 (-) Transcript_21615:48-2264(-)|eukprot:CAMPEP_0171335634 /NCGR_PEP_ID=MMETSP0878-20121228/5482_1 /TAXON_ID=67004 /ORGANISM="Thalassiosira weissflogii, Strain CCMP1336" /LENGTH=738 /DNA_ID=CAMNT_0011836947 /DNA_START=128 /DNA_END=2344 /DNA_ORIENTATION=+
MAPTKSQNAIPPDLNGELLSNKPLSPKNHAGGNHACIHVSRLLLAVCVFSAALTAFGLGGMASVYYNPETGVVTDPQGASTMDSPTESNMRQDVVSDSIPCTRYSSRVFGENRIHTVLVDQSECIGAQNEYVEDDCSDDDSSDDDQEIEEEKEEEELSVVDSLPAGFYLMIDARKVNESFLNSHDRLQTIITDLLKTHGFESLLSYHCHLRDPTSGVSCFGLLPHSHFSLHAFPQDSVLFFDFFSKGELDLYPLYEDIKDMLYGNLDQVDEKKPEINFPDVKVLWAQFMRGFREGFSDDYDVSKHPIDGELTNDIYAAKNDFIIKNRLVSLKTKFQQVDIFKTLPDFHGITHKTHVKSLSNDGSYESRNKELFMANKEVYLDGDVQSSSYGEVQYHEALVHPAMITHPNPNRVAIIGGGEGATLREILKHKTVEEVVMVDIDEEFVNLCKVYLPEWSDCSDLVGSSGGSCFDDKRAKVHFEDAFKYFIDRYGGNSTWSEQDDEELFDVIIMDACDPTDEFVDKLYKSSLFVQSFYNALNEDGVFIAQIGRSPYGVDGGNDETSVFKNAFRDVGFKSMHIYDEGHALFDLPWSYLIALKHPSMRNRWYQNPAKIELELKNRIHKTHSGKPNLLRFDGSTMFEYQIPSKVYENVYCRLPLGETLDECDNHLGFSQTASHASTINEDDTLLSNPYNPLFERHSGDSQAKGKNHTLCDWHPEKDFEKKNTGFTFGFDYDCVH